MFYYRQRYDKKCFIIDRDMIKNVLLSKRQLGTNHLRFGYESSQRWVRIISTLGTNRLGTKRPWVRNVRIPCEKQTRSRVLARLASLAQIEELARRLKTKATLACTFPSKLTLASCTCFDYPLPLIRENHLSFGLRRKPLEATKKIPTYDETKDLQNIQSRPIKHTEIKFL